ncbi:enoyl-CoA hydratase/isomerase family protein [Novosphingobium sp. Gsoil 351]|uniref:enoyl-CoA hydratase/isomerase family protein n=1 Tax=Novosphingobium sp. Gsoil 351 TaxID=2675225 RepID=UPI0012B493F2|nr:enoyl-CoA hydratase/isomerase family protein [Novosphingobium sp. Gsoil 351]QGN54422.1 enoyl-CoA hydratase/isomerase family protein [Novosphingobium sp. Gsoil 351]
MTDEVLIRTEGSAGFLSLNRPKALHALTVDMVHAMTAALIEWRDDPAIHTVIVDHAEGRGFCAGGDIAYLRQSVLDDAGERGLKFFHDEYQLNHLMFEYHNPIVSFVDGIVMGGGVGVSQPARFRVATEHTRFAMPETGIGLFPDVGGSWYLSRLPGRIGQFLVLTGARLDGAECLWSGLATHYLPSDALAEAKERIAHGHEPGGVLSALSVTPPHPRIEDNATQIARHFASDRLEDAIASLEADDSVWAAKELAAVRAKSPLSSKVALRQLADGARCQSFAEAMAMEYRIVSRILTRPDFAEGVRAVIVDKDNAPKWDPATPEAVPDSLIDAIFAALPADKEWKPL